MRSISRGIPIPQWNEFAYLVRKSFQSGFRCAYCGITMNFSPKNGDGNLSRFTIDHRVPIAIGGSNESSNLCVCCEGCNREKGSMNEREFKEFVRWRSLWQFLFPND